MYNYIKKHGITTCQFMNTLEKLILPPVESKSGYGTAYINGNLRNVPKREIIFANLVNSVDIYVVLCRILAEHIVKQFFFLKKDNKQVELFKINFEHTEPTSYKSFTSQYLEGLVFFNRVKLYL